MLKEILNLQPLDGGGAGGGEGGEEAEDPA